MSGPMFPEGVMIVNAIPPTTTNGAVTFDNISLKNVQKVWILAHFKQAATHVTTITPRLGAAVASCATAITFAARWWKITDVATSDTWVAQTAATTMACTAGATDQMIMIEVNPADCLAQGATLDCLGATLGASSEVTNFVSAVYLIWPRYASQPSTAPSYIID